MEKYVPKWPTAAAKQILFDYHERGGDPDKIMSEEAIAKMILAAFYSDEEYFSLQEENIGMGKAIQILQCNINELRSKKPSTN